MYLDFTNILNIVGKYCWIFLLKDIDKLMYDFILVLYLINIQNILYDYQNELIYYNFILINL